MQDTLEGLQTTLDTTAKLSSANTFTGLQTIVGDLKADNVLVKNTTPTLTTQLTSKLYVDTALNGKQDTLTAGTNITISGNTISSTGGITQAQLDTKQNTLTAGTNITIPGNTISATGVITQAQLDTKQNTLTSSIDILTKRIDVSNKKYNVFSFRWDEYGNLDASRWSMASSTKYKQQCRDIRWKCIFAWNGRRQYIKSKYARRVLATSRS